MILILAAALLLLAVQSDAQQPQQPPAPIERPPQSSPDIPTLRLESRLVSVALNVADEHGAPVAGLTQADFELAEDDRPQKIAFFDRESATPLEIVLSLDASESVFSDARLERDAARSFVKGLLHPQDRLDLMAFADSVDELVGFTADTRRIDAGLGQIERGEATALYDAIYLAGQRLAQTSLPGSPRKVIVLITDGENTTRHGSYDAALEQAQRAGAMIYSLIIVPIQADAGRNTGGEHALIQMARDTGGKFYYVADKTDLAPAFQHVSDDLRTQYTLGYYAPAHGVEISGLRHIHIQLKDPALRARYTLRYRTAYYASR